MTSLFVAFKLKAEEVNLNLPEQLSFPKPQELQLSAYQSLSTTTLANIDKYESYKLDSVTIISKRRNVLTPAEQSRKDRSYLYGGNPTYRMVIDSVPGAIGAIRILDLFYRLPGVQVIGGSVQIRGPSSFLGSNSPLYVVDGIPVDRSFLSSIPVTDVEFIDVLAGADAAIYGSRGGNGVILIYTRIGGRGGSLGPSPGIMTFDLKGFHKVREFAVFDPLTDPNPDRPDLRTTLHWNPRLEADATGQIFEKFTTSDQEGTYLIIAQGIRKDGQPLFGMSRFFVRTK